MRVTSSLWVGLALASVLISSQPSLATTVTLDTGLPTSNKYGFGPINSFTPTFGETFTAPITGVLTSFTLYLTETGAGNLVGGIDAWNAGTTSSTANLFTSAPVAATVTGFPPATAVAYTFSTDIAVTAGQTYVAFLSMFGVSGAGGNGQMPFQFTASEAPIAGGGHMYWTNASPFGSAAWTTDGFRPGWVEFQATFSDTVATPLPAALPLFASGIGAMGLFGWRRRRKTEAAA